MQPAQPQQGDNIANLALVWRPDRAGDPTIRVKGSVAAIFMIIGQVTGERLAEALRVEDDDVI